MRASLAACKATRTHESELSRQREGIQGENTSICSPDKNSAELGPSRGQHLSRVRTIGGSAVPDRIADDTYGFRQFLLERGIDQQLVCACHTVGQLHALGQEAKLITIERADALPSVMPGQTSAQDHAQQCRWLSDQHAQDAHTADQHNERAMAKAQLKVYKVKKESAKMPLFEPTCKEEGDCTAADKHALATPPASATESLKTLAEWLVAPFSEGRNKHRAIFRWICANVSYDGLGFKNGDYGDNSAEGVFKTRRAVCAGYSNLYKAMADVAGLECESCSGYCKGFSYKPGCELKVNHAWNIIRYDGGDWHPIDSTWAAGNLSSDFKFNFKFTNEWWSMPASRFFFTHYPVEADRVTPSQHFACQKDKMIGPQFWDKLQALTPSFFESGLQLCSHDKAVINAQPREMIKIALNQSLPRRVYLLVNDASGTRLPDHSYDEVCEMHTISVRAPGSDLGMNSKISIFWSPQKYGTFSHLLDYIIKVEA